jgi:hypothetical protein
MLSVSRRHRGGEMARAREPALAERPEQLARMTPIVDDDEPALDAGEPFDELIVAQNFGPLRSYALQPPIEIAVWPDDLAHVLESLRRIQPCASC